MTSFDEQLALSAPPVPARSPGLDAELDRVLVRVDAAESRRRRRRRGAAISGLVVVGALGAGGAAAAAGLMSWWESAPSNGVVTTSSGTRCSVAFGVKELRDAAAPVSDEARQEARKAAEKYLRDVDFSQLSARQGARAAAPTAEPESDPTVTVEEGELDAVYAEVGRGLDAELARRQLPTSAVSLSMLSSCDGDDQ